MLALILRHKATHVETPSGVLILHTTHQPVLVGDTPLSRVLLNHYVKGFRIFVYDKTVHKRREKIVPPKNLGKFLSTAAFFYAHSKMTLEQVPYKLNNTRTIEIDTVTYNLKDIK